MRTLVLPAASREGLERALAVLRAGGLVAFPTDTVYGVGALAFDANAVGRIYLAKDRPVEKAIPILLGSATDMNLVALEVPDMAWRLARRFWPGPLTLIVSKNASLPAAVAPTDTVGVRQPDHAAARTLLQAAGPMAVTSANLSGLPSPSTAEDVLAQLQGRVDLILDGGRTPGGVPSTIVDCTKSEPVVIRDGPVTLEQVKAALT